MTSPTGDDRFDSREDEVQYYRDWIDDCRPRWSDAEKRDFAKTVVRLKEQPGDRDRSAPTA